MALINSWDLNWLSWDDCVPQTMCEAWGRKSEQELSSSHHVMWAMILGYIYTLVNLAKNTLPNLFNQAGLQEVTFFFFIVFFFFPPFKP